MDGQCNCVGISIANYICLKEVHFKGTTFSSGYIPIRMDDNSDFYKAPQFEMEYPSVCPDKTGATIKTQHPVAYESDTKANIKAIFETTLNGYYYIRGMGPYLDATGTNQLEFESQKCNASGGIVEYDFKAANKRFIDKQVKYWDKFIINWQISEDELAWEDIGKSENQMYVTYDEPYTPPIYPIIPFDGHLEETVVFHTILHLGCTNAKDLTDPQTIVDDIYTKGFGTSGGYNKVYRVDGAGPINYWGFPSGTPTVPEYYWKTSGLLNALSGRCGGWAVFFEDVLRIQGISTSEISTVTYNNFILNSTDYNKLENEGSIFFGSQWSNVFKLNSNYNITTNTNDVRSDFLLKIGIYQLLIHPVI